MGTGKGSKSSIHWCLPESWYKNYQKLEYSSDIIVVIDVITEALWIKLKEKFWAAKALKIVAQYTKPEKIVFLMQHLFWSLVSQKIVWSKLLPCFKTMFSAKNSLRVRICRFIQINPYHVSLGTQTGLDVNSQSEDKTRLYFKDFIKNSIETDCYIHDSLIYDKNETIPQ